MTPVRIGPACGGLIQGSKDRSRRGSPCSRLQPIRMPEPFGCEGRRRFESTTVGHCLEVLSSCSTEGILMLNPLRPLSSCL